MCNCNMDIINMRNFAMSLFGMCVHLCTEKQVSGSFRVLKHITVTVFSFFEHCFCEENGNS